VAADEIKDTTGAEPAAAGDQPQPEAAPAEEPQEKPARQRRTVKADAPAAAKPRKAAAKPAAKAAADAPQAEAAEAAAADEPQTEAAQPESKEAEKPAAKPRARARKAAADKAPTKEKKAVAEKPAAKARPPKAQKTPKPPRAERPKPGPLEGTVIDADGRIVETVSLTAERFGVAANINMLHLVVRAEQAARRRGTASSKTRGEVSGTTAKMYRQKGTGRARAGSVKSPVRSGGGVAFGPRPRDFSIKVNRKVVRKALDMALSSRADAGNVFVTRGLALDSPSNRMLVAVDMDAPVLVVTSGEPEIARSVRNLSYAESAEVRELTTETVLRARSLVFTERAFGALDQA
jgi:large subunit ribosomal protein L4